MQIFKLYFQDASSEAAYQASLVTRDRALANRQQSIDIMKRLISQMEDDPLMKQARISLEKIMANPDVITDEVFNNIMSKTQEVLDANYDSQVEQFLDTARSRGVAGDTLAIQLSKAKNARAQGMAAAYRDAIISRSKEGLTTSLEAIKLTSDSLTNFYQNKRLAAEGLVNVVQSLVAEPFVYSGPPSEAMIGGAGGGGGAAGGGSRTAIPINDPMAGRSFGDMGQATAEELARIQSMPGQPGSTPTQVTSGAQTSAQQVAGGTPTGGSNVPTSPLSPDQILASDTANYVANDMLPAERDPVTGEMKTTAIGDMSAEQLSRLTAAIGKEFKTPQALNLSGGLVEGMKTAASKSVSDMLTKSPASQSINKTTLNVSPPATSGVLPQKYIVTPQGSFQGAGDLDTRAANMVKMTTGGGAGVTMGGGLAEADRVSQMIGQTNQRTGAVITPDQIIGTTAGGGVRQVATSVAAQTGNENWKQIAGPNGTMKWVPMNAAEIAAAKKKKAGAGTTIVTSSGLGTRKSATSYSDQLKNKVV